MMGTLTYLKVRSASAKTNYLSDIDLGVFVHSSIRHEDYFNIESIVATEMENRFKNKEIDIRILKYCLLKSLI
ncbi:MAG: hypothetical protein ABH952_01350 [Candidatus Omnitrophota bacterium]